MLAASCGLDRDADEAISEADSTGQTAGEDGAATPTPEPVPVPPGIPDGQTAATVTFTDGTEVEISSTQLNEFHDTIQDDIDFSIGAFGPNGMPAAFRSSVLSDLIIDSLIDNLSAEVGSSPSDEDIAEGTATLEQTIASFFPLDDDPIATAQGRFETLPYLRFLAELQAKQIAFGEALVGAEGDADTVEVPCSSHILLATEEEANDVVALLEDGGDFAELAMEFSTGPSGPTGGELGCTDPNTFVAEFRDAITDAPVGTIIGPVQTEFGFHVITVTALEEQAVNAPDAQSLVGAELRSAISQIEVDVDPELGTWDAASGIVIPPG